MGSIDLGTGGAPIPSSTAPLRHARLALPPVLGWHSQRYTGARLQGVDADAVLKLPGVLRVVQQRHLVAVIADSDAQARQACALLKLRWSSPAAQEQTLRPRQKAHLYQRGKDESAGHDLTLEADYQWQDGEAAMPMQDMIVLAVPGAKGIRIDLPFGNPGLIARELAALLCLPVAGVEVRSHRAAASAGEYRAASDAAGVAALLCKQCGEAISLVLPQADAPPVVTSLHLRGEFDEDGTLGQTALEITQDLAPPPLAWLLTEAAYPLQDAAANNGEALASPYDWRTVHVSGPLETSVPVAAGCFAQEIFLDEVAQRLGQDPVSYRLAHLPDPHGTDLIRSVAQGAGWQHARQRAQRQDKLLRGRGFAYASTIEQQAGQPVQSWSAWVADVEYDPASGELSVARVTAGHDVRALGVPAAPGPALEQASTEQLGQQARLALAQSLHGGHGFDAWSRELSAPPAALKGAALPVVELVKTPPALQNIELNAGAAFTLPAAAAISNAVYAATGVRLRQAPFSGEQVRLALNASAPATGMQRWRKYGWLGAAVAAVGTMLTLTLPWRGEIAPIARPDPGLYSAATIERGRRVALAGDCAVCHTAPGGVANAGGHALQTPFGTIYSTNITPDEHSGIGNWSYAAFERAMREGIHRDGRHLYPAFPYTAFAKISEADLQSLYAYLMAQPAVASTPPANDLRFPFNVRPLLAGWNTLFHDPREFQPDPARSDLWNRGAYLVQGAGHCAACHSPRNALGAEQGGRQYLGGGTVDGWEAPALTALSKSPTPWTEEELFAYLRTGFSAPHGIAAGPMAPVVAELAQLPPGDVRAIAHYLASFQSGVATRSATPAPVIAAQAPGPTALQSLANGQRLFAGACAACHQEGTGPTLFGVKPSLRVNTNLHSDTPDNLVHVILHGIREPANPALGYMPGFANSFSDAQMVDLLAYLRSEFAGGKPAWQGVEASIARSRAMAAH
ncbi:c-type cytochrome [Herbaspirillum sp. WGmk3]|uniref:c-type cytochrome n=1 Tax=Herbaspirillum sp. WGmk3 TaxID=2919925 RepID=UPI002090BF01|nr:c-type cytochrome [Herbaspirillum sp. WGmk3]MCO4858376.1 c-type cytochrome [Herbaspirillum sp. WGmk3]